MVREASKLVPEKCGDAFILRCISSSTKGEYDCSVFKMENKLPCGGAFINTKKGTVRFYE